MPFIQLQFRRGTAASWTLQNSLLAVGEMAIESDTNLFKIGDGVTRWNLLPYGGLQGPTGEAGGGGGGGGDTGATGPTGQGDKYLSATTTAVTPNPVQGGSVTLTIGSKLSYITGNSLLVINSTNSSVRFEGRVQSYNSTSGAITIGSITNILGTFTSSIYNVNLDGIDGPTGPTGPSGSVTVYSITFDGGFSNNSYVSGPVFDCGTSV